MNGAIFSEIGWLKSLVLLPASAVSRVRRIVAAPSETAGVGLPVIACALFLAWGVGGVFVLGQRSPEKPLPAEWLSKRDADPSLRLQVEVEHAIAVRKTRDDVVDFVYVSTSAESATENFKRPEPDAKAQQLGETVHRQLTAIDRLSSFTISTQTFTSYYGDPEEVIGLKGDTINDWRHVTHVKYPFDPDMPESDIHAMVDAAQTKRLENLKLVDDLLKPLKEMIGKPAPKLDGDWIGQSEPPAVDQSKPTLLHFWATWCGPCKNDIPQLNKMADAGWNIVGIHAPRTDPDKVAAAMKTNGIEYPVLLGNETKGSGINPDQITGYPVRIFPLCILIDKKGKIEAVGRLSEILGQK